MIITVRLPAINGTRWGPGVADSMIGTDVPLQVGVEAAVGVVAEAVVSDDGEAILLTIELDEAAPLSSSELARLAMPMLMSRAAVTEMFFP